LRFEDLPDWALTDKERVRRYKQKARHEGKALEFGEMKGEAEILAEIKALAAEGFRPFQIAQKLNDRGRMARGKRWYETTVRRIVERDCSTEQQPTSPPIRCGS